MKEIRLANKVIKTLVKDRIHYPGRLITDTIAIIARCGILLILYWYVFQLKGGTVNEIPYHIIAWSIFLYFVFSIFRLRDITSNIEEDIRTGNIEVLLSKPISYLLYKIYWQIGSGIYSVITILFFGSIALTIILGIPETMTLGMFFPTVLLCFITSSILSLLLFALLGLAAFWIENTKPLFWIIDKSIMVLGGSYLPIALFPDTLYLIARYSPFGASIFVSHAPNPNWQSDWFILISIQMFWIVIISGITYFVFKQAKQRVSVNGG